MRDRRTPPRKTWHWRITGWTTSGVVWWISANFTWNINRHSDNSPWTKAQCPQDKWAMAARGDGYRDWSFALMVLVFWTTRPVISEWESGHIFLWGKPLFLTGGMWKIHMCWRCSGPHAERCSGARKVYWSQEVRNEAVVLPPHFKGLGRTLMVLGSEC